MFISVLISVFLKKIVLLYDISALQLLAILQGAIFVFLLPFMLKARFNFFDKNALKDNMVRNLLYVFSLWLLYSSLKYIPINVNIGIQFLVPIFSCVLAIFFLKEKHSLFIWLSFLFCIIGAVIIRGGFSGETHEYEFCAYLYLLVFVVVRSFGNILNRKLAVRHDTKTLIFYSNTIMFVVPFVLILLTGWYKPIPLDIFIYLCFAGLLYLIEYVLVFRAFKYCTVLETQPLEFSKLVYAIVLSNIVLNEAPTGYQIAGSIFIASGFTVAIFETKRKQMNFQKNIKK